MADNSIHICTWMCNINNIQIDNSIQLHKKSCFVYISFNIWILCHLKTVHVMYFIFNSSSEWCWNSYSKILHQWEIWCFKRKGKTIGKNSGQDWTSRERGCKYRKTKPLNPKWNFIQVTGWFLFMKLINSHAKCSCSCIFFLAHFTSLVTYTCTMYMLSGPSCRKVQVNFNEQLVFS